MPREPGENIDHRSRIVGRQHKSLPCTCGDKELQVLMRRMRRRDRPPLRVLRQLRTAAANGRLREYRVRLFWMGFDKTPAAQARERWTVVESMAPSAAISAVNSS